MNKYQNQITIVMLTVTKDNYKQELAHWTQLQLLKGISKNEICSIAKEQFGNGKILSDSTINKFYSCDYKNQTKIKSAKNKSITYNELVEAKKIADKLSKMKKSTASKVLDMVFAIANSANYGSKL